MKRCLAIAALLLVAACHRAAPANRLKRVNDRIGETFRHLSEQKRFAGVVPSDWTVDHFSASGEKLELGFKDASGGDHVVELLLNLTAEARVDGRGNVFSYFVSRGGDDGTARAALLAAAGIIDAATPPEALVSVEPPRPDSPPPRVDENAPPAGYREPMEARKLAKGTALVIAAIESLIVLIAIVLAVVVPLRAQARSAER